MSRTENTLQLLHALGYIYANYGQTKRALVLQLIASRIAPDDKALLRTLAYTFLSDGAPERALAVIARLQSLDEDDPALALLHSRALWEAGREIEARQMFSEFLDRSRQTAHA
jgi:type III secretion protein Y